MPWSAANSADQRLYSRAENRHLFPASRRHRRVIPLKSRQVTAKKGNFALSQAFFASYIIDVRPRDRYNRHRQKPVRFHRQSAAIARRATCPFSSDVKKELSNVKPEKSCCALSELCGLYASMASLNLLGRGTGERAIFIRKPGCMPQGIHAAFTGPAHYRADSLCFQRPLRRQAQMRAHAGPHPFSRAAVCPGHDGKKRKWLRFSQIHHPKASFDPWLLHARFFARHAAGGVP